MEHLIALATKGEAPWLKHFVTVINASLRGELPQQFMSDISTSRLIGINKPDTPPDQQHKKRRPIGMGSIILKFDNKVLLHMHKDQITHHLANFQFGHNQSGLESFFKITDFYLQQTNDNIL